MGPNKDLLIVDRKHNGPPGSGNGGWTSGLIAACVTTGVPEVMLRKPPPLDTPMIVADGKVLDPGGVVIATVVGRDVEIPAVPGVGFEAAESATLRYPGHGEHHFPTCFVCGPEREDGLRIFPGRLGDGRTAAIFDTPADVEAATIWAALDCPGGWTVIEGDHPWVLGRIAAIIDELPKHGERCVVMGQAVSRSGRKAVVRTSLYGNAGDLLARAEATWIALS